MRFNAFLNEKTYVTQRNEDWILNALKKYCNNNWNLILSKKKPIIYHGDDLIHTFYTYNGSNTRININSRSYLSILNSLPSWQNFPNRSKSLMFTTDIITATKYGDNVYITIPYDNAKIAWCHIYDFWSILKNHPIFTTINISNISQGFMPNFIPRDIKSMTELNAFLNMTLKEMYLKYFDTNFTQVKFNVFIAIAANYNITKASEFMRNTIWDYENILTKHNLENIKIKDIYNTVLSPERLNCHIKTYSELYSYINKDHECWTEDKCILIEYNEFVQILKKYNILI